MELLVRLDSVHGKGIPPLMLADLGQVALESFADGLDQTISCGDATMVDCGVKLLSFRAVSRV